MGFKNLMKTRSKIPRRISENHIVYERPPPDAQPMDTPLLDALYSYSPSVSGADDDIPLTQFVDAIPMKRQDATAMEKRDKGNYQRMQRAWNKGRGEPKRRARYRAAPKKRWNAKRAQTKKWVPRKKYLAAKRKRRKSKRK